MHRLETALVDTVARNERVVAAVDMLLGVVHVMGGLLVLLGRRGGHVGGPRGGLVASLGSLGVDGLTLVLDIGHIATVGAHIVSDSLDATIGKGDPVRSLEVAGAIVDLLLVKVGAGVGVIHSVLVVVGRIGLMVIAARPLGLVDCLPLGRGRLELIGVLRGLVSESGGGGKGQTVDSLLERR